MFTLLTCLKLFAEIALVAFAGRFLTGMLAGASRERNPVWMLFALATDPLVNALRRVTPAALPDHRLPMATVLLLCALWLAATGARIALCLDLGIARCR